MEDKQVVEFIHWLLELMPPKYTGDVHRRYIPQVTESKDIVWVEAEGNKFSFYSTQELLKLWKHKGKKE